MSGEVGTTAPAFNLLDTDGNEFNSSSRAGKKTVIAFFPAAFSGVCAEELCSFRDALADFTAVDAEVVGISIDGRFANGAFRDANNLPFAILSDYKQTTIADYDVVWPDFAGMDGYTTARRSVFVVGTDGNISWKWLSDVPSDLPSIEDVQAAVNAAS
ncbi:redoxin domain-containing protein [Candidatus Lucifugimonas marina]|uniref:Redoxin domain-containing protein n=1 Tax=Candidatus Lucifugimonas marina TaxID=3038979 RepID=A0AAJ6CRN8_9CHLR|nr:redoxin domain-containing protein [SAR202 cluster bacterium JH702]MDG0868851.1 redoxin domain-containing protein [SAR202 cluster bacterium JH639]WFG35479.1 redoxin domain-containing protein [SAR202 cluster bacterium JH545]WFG39426.1 redoxin domain-containing protein [SAR202 cluster bacterium JH1073]